MTGRARLGRAALLALVTLFALGAGPLRGVGNDREPTPAEQARAAALLEKWGAQFKMEEVRPGHQAVVQLAVGNDDFTDEHLAYIGSLPELRTLSIGADKITGAGLANLRGRLRHLQRLNLAGSSLTDDALKHLQDFPRLEHLILAQAPVTDAGMKHIGQLTKLRSLSLIGTQVTDDGLAELKGLSKLEGFSVDGPKITDKGLKHLEALTGLKGLSLNQTAVTDTGLEVLKSLPSLRSLGLQGAAKVTDAGMRHLASLKQLEVLGVDGTLVTDEGVKELKALNNLTQLLLPDRVSDEAFEEIKKTVKSPKAVMRLPWPRGQVRPRP